MFVMTIVLCTGCLTANHNIVITANGGTISKELIMEQSTYDALLGMGMTTDELTAEGGTITTFTEDDVDYVKLSVEESFASLAELETAIISLGTESNEDDSTPYFTDFSLKLENDKYVISGTFNTIEDIDTLYTKCTLSFTLPGSISSFNVGSKTSDKTVTINMLKAWEADATKSFEIVANAGPNMMLIVIIGIGVAVLAGLGIFTISLVSVRNKQRASATASSSEPTFTDIVDSQLPTNEEPEDFYVDANGNTYYLDDNGNPYYLDSNGTPYYIDSNGNPFYLDSEGRPFYIDSEGRPFYVDTEGNAFYVDENGRPFILDEEGNGYYIDEDN